MPSTVMRILRRSLRFNSIVSTRKLASVSMEQEARERIHVNALTFGSPGSGKTSLNSKLTKISHEKYGRVSQKTVNDIDRVDNSSKDKKKASSFKGSKNVTHLEWDTSSIRVAHTDVPTASAYVKNFLTHISIIDAAIWVIDSNEGVLEDALTQYKLIKHMASNGNHVHVIPFISNDPEPEVLELIKMDLECVLTKEEYDHILCCSTQVPKLMDKLFTSKDFNRNEDNKKPLLWHLENVGSIPSKGTFIAGRLESGTVKDQETVSAFYKGVSSPVTIRSCEIFRRPCGYLMSRERGGAYIRIKNDSQLELKKGGVLFKEGDDGLGIGRVWEVELYSEEGKEVKGSHSLVLIHRNTYDGTCKIEDNEIKMNPGQRVCTKISLNAPILAKKSDRFLIKLPDAYVYGVFKNVLN